MKLTAAILIILFAGDALKGQSITDSVSVLYTEDLPITERIRTGRRIEQKYEKELSYNDQHNLNMQMGVLLLSIDSLLQSLEFFRKVAIAGLKMNETSDAALAFNNMGVAFYYMGQLDSSGLYFTKTLEYADTNNYTHDQLSTLMNLGLINFQLGNLQLALDNSLTALRIADKDTFHVVRFGSLSNIGMIHFGLGDFEKAVEYQKKALKSAILAESRDDIAAAHGDIGLAFLRSGQLDSARHYLNISKRLNRSLSSKAQLLHTYVHLGEVFKIEGQYDSMYFYLKQALEGRKAIGDVNGLAEVYNHLADYFVEVERPDSAEWYAKRAMEAAEKSTAKKEQFKAFKSLLMAELLKADGSSTRLLTELLRLQNEMLSDERVKAIQYAETRFQTAKKNQQISLLEKERALQLVELKQRKQQLIFTGIAAGLILLMGIVLFNYQRAKRRNREKLLKERERVHLAEKTAMKREQELATFKAQIRAQEKERSRISRELHDGITPTLAATRMRLGDTPEEQALITSLSKIADDLRNLSHQLAPIALDYQTLEESIAHFLAAFDSEDGLTIHLSFPEDGLPALNVETQISIYRTVQELMNNILKHANAHTAEFHFSQSDTTLVLEVKDDGVGISQADLDKPGLGITNLKQRIKGLGGTLSIPLNQGVGTYVEVVIPLS